MTRERDHFCFCRENATLFSRVDAIGFQTKLSELRLGTAWRRKSARDLNHLMGTQEVEQKLNLTAQTSRQLHGSRTCLFPSGSAIMVGVKEKAIQMDSL